MRTSVSRDKVVTNHSGKARGLQGSGCFLRTAVSAGNEHKELLRLREAGSGRRSGVQGKVAEIEGLAGVKAGRKSDRSRGTGAAVRAT